VTLPKPEKPTFLELAKQALSSTERGYDLLAPKFEATPFRTPDEVLVPSVSDLGEVDDALDLCTGTGAALVALRPFVRRRMVGVDFSRGMLDEAKRRLEAAPGRAAFELVQKDVFGVDYEDAFDLVTCFGAFGHILAEAEPAFVAIVRKALRPGGRFVFVTTERPSPWSRASLLGHGFNAAMRLRNALVSPPFLMYYLTFLLPDCERLLRWNGFDVRVDRDMFPKPFAPFVRVVATRR
jgi:SAM-dependent methyltransferase